MSACVCIAKFLIGILANEIAVFMIHLLTYFFYSNHNVYNFFRSAFSEITFPPLTQLGILYEMRVKSYNNLLMYLLFYHKSPFSKRIKKFEYIDINFLSWVHIYNQIALILHNNNSFILQMRD